MCGRLADRGDDLWWAMQALCLPWGFSKRSIVILVALVLAVPVTEQRTVWATRKQEWTSQQAVNWWGRSNPWPRQQRGKDVYHRWAPLLPSLTWSVWVTRTPCWSQQPTGWAQNWRCVFFSLFCCCCLSCIFSILPSGAGLEKALKCPPAYTDRNSLPHLFIDKARLFSHQWLHYRLTSYCSQSCHSGDIKLISGLSK